jgi:hypothetical protein
MAARWLTCLTAIGFIAAATPARCAEAKKIKPALLVKIRSLNAVVEDGKYLAALAGKEEYAKQIASMIKARTDEKGLEGLDPKRPLGVYNRDLFDLPPVVMVPIADADTFLKLLKTLRLKATKDEKGIYTVPIDFLRIEVEAYFRIANGYAYITAQNMGALEDARLLDPAELKSSDRTALASATLFLDHISKDSKDLAISELERQVKRLQKRKPPRETETEEKIRVRILKDLAAGVAQVIREGRELGMRFEVDSKAQKLGLTFRLTGQADSKLSENITALGQSASLFTSLVKDDGAGSLLVHLAIPKTMRKIIEPMMDDRLKEIQEKEADEGKRELVASFIKAITPSLKSGEVDALLSLRGPSDAGRYTAVIALKLKEGQNIEKVVRDVIDKVAPATEKAKIKFDAEKTGEVSIHRVAIEKSLDKKFKKLFGDAPLYFAFRDDAVVLTLGEGSLEAIKETVTAKPKAGPVLEFELALARLLPLVATSPKHAAAVKAAKEVFDEDDKDKGMIRVTLGGGKELMLRSSVSGAVVKFVILAAQEARKRARSEEEKARLEAEKGRKEAEKKKEKKEKDE